MGTGRRRRRTKEGGGGDKGLAVGAQSTAVFIAKCTTRLQHQAEQRLEQQEHEPITWRERELCRDSLAPASVAIELLQLLDRRADLVLVALGHRERANGGGAEPRRPEVSSRGALVGWTTVLDL